MFATRMLAIGSLLWGMSAFAQSSAARLDYSGRIFEPGGNPLVGPISVRADIRVTVAGNPCVLYRRIQLEGASDQITADMDGHFSVVFRTGANTIDVGEYEAANLQSILSTSQVTPLTCLDGATTFVPNSGSERIAEISVSLNGGSTWMVVDEQLVSPAHQANDTIAFGGFGLANFVYDNGDGKITRARVETLLASTHSDVLSSIVQHGTLALSSMHVASVDAQGTSVVNRDYADQNLAGVDATALGTLGVGQANQLVMWDGVKWSTTSAPTDDTKLPLAGGTLTGAVRISGASSDVSFVNQADLVMGTDNFIYLARHVSAPALTSAHAGAFWVDTSAAHDIKYFDGTTALSVLTSASNIAGLNGTVAVNRGGTGTGSLTPNSLLTMNGTGTAMQGLTCTGTQISLWNGTAWGCANLPSGTANEVQFRSGGTLGSSSRFYVHSDGRVGIGDSSYPEGDVSVYANNTVVNPGADSSAAIWSMRSRHTSSTNNSSRGIYARVLPDVSSGMTNSGANTALVGHASPEPGSSGNLGFLTGLIASVGTSTGYTGSVGYVTGIHIQPSRVSGTITNYVGLRLDPPTGPGALVNEFGVLQYSATARNELEGSMLVGTTGLPGTDVFRVYRGGNTETVSSFTNPTNGTAASSSLQLKTNNGLIGKIFATSSSYSTSHMADRFHLQGLGSGLSISSDQDIKFYTLGNAVSNESMRITNGSVSIGTTLTDAKLSLAGAAGKTLKIADGNQGLGKVLTSDASGFATWQTPTGGGGSVTVPYTGNGHANAESHILNYAASGTSNTQAAEATYSNLNFSGTGGPDYLISNYGHTRIAGNPKSIATITGGLFRTTVDSGTVNSIDGVSAFVENTAGAVTHATAGRFEFYGADTGISNGYGIYIDNIFGVNKYSIYANQTNAPSYLAGSLGIGTNLPSASLDVRGISGKTIRIIDGNQGAGKVLTSDASGVASWQQPAGSISTPHSGTGSALGNTSTLNYNATAASGGIASAFYGITNMSGTGGPQIVSSVHGSTTTTSGQITTQYLSSGSFFTYVNAGAQATNAIGMVSSVNISGTVGTAYGNQVQVNTNANTTTAYGVHIDIAGAVASKWAIYSPSSAPSFHAGYLGINKVVPTVALDVVGNAAIDGNLSVTGAITAATVTPSDLRFKKEIASIEGALAQVLRIEGKTYRYRTEQFPERFTDGRTQFGVIAQDLEMIYPHLVRTDADGYKSVNYVGLIAPMIEATRELNDRYETARQRLEALEKENAEMKERLSQIEEYLKSSSSK